MSAKNKKNKYDKIQTIKPVKKTTHSIPEYNVEEYVFNITSDIIEDKMDISKCVAKHTKIVKISIGGEKLLKKIRLFPLMMYTSISRKVYLDGSMSIIGE